MGSDFPDTVRTLTTSAWIGIDQSALCQTLLPVTSGETLRSLSRGGTSDSLNQVAS